MQQQEKTMKRILVSGVLAMLGGLVMAKLPPPDEATKAKAAETAAKQAWQAKVDAYLLCKAQDKVVARYKKTAGNGAGKDVKPASTALPVAAAKPASQASSPSAGGTPVAAAPPGPCSDPGPFAYNPPAQKPLETSGAHSPSGTAASPPSVKPESAKMAPAK
jgi:hypothetical protein